MRTHIAIIGGGIVGSTIVCQPARTGRAGDVVVIERDTTCEDYATCRFPSISTQGVALSVLSEHDAWMEPNAALKGFRRKARALGVRCVAGAAFRLDLDSPPCRKFGSVVADNRRGAVKR